MIRAETRLVSEHRIWAILGWEGERNPVPNKLEL